MRLSEYKYDRMHEEITMLKNQITKMEIENDKKEAEDWMFVILSFLLGTSMGIALVILVQANA
jgi:hypothetical protein